MFPLVIVAFNDATTCPVGSAIVIANVSRPAPGSPASTRSKQFGLTQSIQCETEHLIHHARRQLAGVGVLPARVIAADEQLPVRQLMRDVVAECRLRTQRDAAMAQ